MTDFANLTPAEQQSIEAELLSPERLYRALEADIYARELLGMNTERSKAKLAKLKAKKK